MHKKERKKEMKMERKDFINFYKSIKKDMPTYNNGRTVKVLHEYQVSGQKIISMGSRWEGNYLQQVYERPSDIKQSIYNDCYDMFVNDEGESFGICSYNGFMFTVSWISEKVFPHMVYLTRDTEFIVLFNE